MSHSPIKIFFDTDIGNDIDDAYALAYAMQNPAVEVLGVATVKFAGELRARFATALMPSLGCSVPLAIGDETVELERGRISERGQLAWAQANLPPSSSTHPSAVDLMYEIATAHPNEVYLVAVGPLSNVAAAFIKYPKLPDLLAGVYVMGGEAVYLKRESNFANDYLAADIVLRKAIRTHLATLSVGARLEDGKEELEALRQAGPTARLLAELTMAWGRAHGPRHYDIIPLLWLEEPSVVEAAPMRVRVETTGLYTRGLLIDMKKNGGGLPIEYCTVPYVDVETGSDAMVTTGLDYPRAKAMMRNVFLAPHIDRRTG